MSGGVDSSVAAGLLSNIGAEVIGITLRLWTPSLWNIGERYGGCCSPQDIAEAKAVCRQLGIPHYTFNLEEKFKEKVVDNFISEYLDGRTPNPCVRCNSFIKFDILFKYALALEADVLATGHYARIKKERMANGEWRMVLKKALDEKKDQSYFLYMLNQEQLSKLLFPVGDYTKVDVRALAEQFNLVTAKKEESQDICFLEGRDYREFIQERVPTEKIEKGAIQTSDGKVLGEHNGLPYYTIGQREKLGIATGQRLYVIEKNVETNTLVVGTEKENLVSECFLDSVNWCSGNVPSEVVNAAVKIRYRHGGAQAAVRALSPTEVKIKFDLPQPSATPGQSAVFYQGEDVLGGGVIARVS